VFLRSLWLTAESAGSGRTGLERLFCAAFVSTKLLFEDLRYGHSGSIAISLFLYAVALIIVRVWGALPEDRECRKFSQ